MDDQNRCMRCMGQKDSQQETCPACGFSEKDFVPEKHHLQPHTILKGQYLVGCALGEGGFGITYIGWDMFLHIPVAIKEYFPSGVVIRDQGQHTVSVFAGKDEESFLQGRRRSPNSTTTSALCPSKTAFWKTERRISSWSTSPASIWARTRSCTAAS